MSPEQKIVQYLNEAHATELALTRVLQSQIAMTPRGSYRSALETHLVRDPRPRPPRRSAGCSELGEGSSTLQAVVGFAETVVGQVLALGKTPLDLLRGTGGEEKVLKNAKDAAATEALEIATYTAIERLAKAVGDDETAQLAASIRADEEKMLERVLREIPKLTDAVVAPTSYDDRSPRRRRDRRSARPERPSGPRARPARCRASPRPKARSRAPSRPRATSRSPATTALTADEIIEPAGRALADRPGQGRLLRAPAREPHDGAGPRSPRCAATSRGRATTSSTSSEVQRRAGRGRRRPRRRPCAPTSARTRTAPACSRPPSASSATPEPPIRPAVRDRGPVRVRTSLDVPDSGVRRG